MIELLLDLLAVHRLTRLITTDRITRALRTQIIAIGYGDYIGPERTEFEWEQRVDLDDDPPMLAALITCRWCVSVWVALAVVLVIRHMPGWRRVRNALALSSAATLLAGAEVS